VKWLMAKAPAERPSSAVRVRELLQTWATPPNAPAPINLVAEADTAMLDPGLWDTTPGEELPVAAPASEANPLALPKEASAEKARQAAPAGLIPTWLLLALLLVGLTGLVVLAVVFRWL
jgi:hypothetical protein